MNFTASTPNYTTVGQPPASSQAQGGQAAPGDEKSGQLGLLRFHSSDIDISHLVEVPQPKDKDEEYTQRMAKLVDFPEVQFPEIDQADQLPAKYYFTDGRKWNGKFATENLFNFAPILPPPDNNLSSNISNSHQTAGNASNQTKFPSLPPVVGVKLFNNNAVVVRSAGCSTGGRGPRGAITEVSSEQIKNAITVLTDSKKELDSILHLTYPRDSYPTDGRIVKAHKKAFERELKKEYGDFDYFVAIEYQKRGAPHLHVATSIDLKTLGKVETLKREQGQRRSPEFQTVLSHNRWSLDTWIKIISRSEKDDPDFPGGYITYEGEKIAWSGITEVEKAAMEKAFGTYNAGVCWEVMRDRDGAKKYLVKELSEKKHYQHLIPDGFTHPGRHFLYNHDFPNREAVEIPVDQASLRQAAETCGWRDGKGRKLTPNANRPLYKRLWNISRKLFNRLDEMGFKPTFDGVLGKIREYWDYRVNHFIPSQIILGVHDVGEWKLLESEIKAKEHWQDRVRRIARDMAWEYDLNQAMMNFNQGVA